MNVYQQKPPLGSEIDLSNPVSRGVILSLPLNEGTGAKGFDLTRRENHAVVVSASIGLEGVDLDGAADYLTMSALSLTAWSVAVRYKPDTVSGTHPILDQGSILLYQSYDDLIYGVTDDRWTAYTGTILACLTAGVPVDILVKRLGTTITCYINGVARGSFTAAGTANSALNNLIVGANSRPGFVFPALPNDLSGENAIVINASDDLQISTGSKSLNSDVVAENWNGNQMTILVWVKLNFVPGDGAAHMIVDNGSGNNRIVLLVTGGGLARFLVVDKDASQHFVDFDISGWAVGSWHQIVARIDFKNDEIELYTDGASRDSVPSEALVSDSIDALGSTAYIGLDFTGIQQLNGAISILAENRSWSDAEITADYAAGAGTPRVVGPYTILYDQFSDSLTGIIFHPSGQGVTATDSGGNVTVDVSDSENLYQVDDLIGLEGADGHAVSGPAFIESASGADVTIGSKIAHADLNGSSQFFSVSDAALPDTGILGDLSIEMWLKPADVSTFQVLVSKYLSAGDKRMFYFGLRNGGQLECTFSVDGAATVNKATTGVNLEVDIWYHVALVYDAAAGTADFYKNGIFIEQETGLPNSIADKDPDFEIGGYNTGAASYEGSIGPTHLFNAIKLPNEIYEASRNFYFDHSGDGTLVCGYLFTEAGAATEIDNVEGTAAGDIIPQDSGAVIYSGLRSTEGSYVQGISEVGVSVDFDGQYDAQAGSNNVLDVGIQDFCLSFSINGSDIANSERIISKRTGGSLGWEIYVKGANIAIFIGDSSGATFDTELVSGINDGRSHHLAILFDRDGNATGYLDGVVGSVQNISARQLTITSAVAVTFGAFTGGGSNFLSGNLSDVKWQLGGLWTPAQILYQATHPHDLSASAGTITEAWGLDEGAGTALAGSAGNTLTLSNAAAWTQKAHLTRNKWVDGSQENGGIGGRVVGSNSVVTKDTSVVKFDGQSEKHVWTAADNGDENTVSTMALVSGNDYATHFDAKITAKHINSSIDIDIDGSATPILSERISGPDDLYNTWIGGNLSFNGTSDYVNVADDNTLDALLTFEAWVKPSEMTTAVASANVLLTKHILFRFGLTYTETTGANQFSIRFQDSLDASSVASWDINANGQFDVWYHVLGKFNSSNKPELFINGISVDEANVLNDALGNGVEMTGAPVRIGGGIVNRYTDCEIAIARAYSIAVSDADILWLSQNPGATKAELIAGTSIGAGDIELYLNFEGDVVTDQSGNANNGTKTGTTYVNEWGRKEFSFTADQQAVTAEVRIDGAGASTNSGTMYLDQAEVIELVAGDALVADLYYTLFYDVDLDVTGSQWSGLGADATEVQAGDLYIRNDTRDADTADRIRDFADGQIEKIEVWERALIASEVQSLALSSYNLYKE